MSEVTLAKIVETRLQQWADAQEIAIAFENTKLTPKQGDIYARVDHLPARRFGAFLSGGHKALTGIWQVMLTGPKGKGLGPLRALADTLDTVFPQNLELVDGDMKFTITDPPSIGPKIDDPEGSKTARVNLPVSIPYRADVVT